MSSLIWTPGLDGDDDISVLSASATRFNIIAFFQKYEVMFLRILLCFWSTNRNLIVPTLLRGEELYTHMGFFVPWIFAARYIHRRELRLVSLESSSSIEYGIKKIFLIFVFYRELSRFKLLRKEDPGLDLDLWKDFKSLVGGGQYWL